MSLSSPQVEIGQLLQQPFANVPAGARLLKRPPLRLNGDSNDCNNGPVYLDCGDNLNDDNTHWAYFGVYRSCKASVEAAVKAGHPVAKANRLPMVVQEVVDAISSKQIFQLAKERHATLSYWLDRAKTLSPAECCLHSSLPGTLGKILAPMRLLLWKAMLIHYGYPDVEVFDEVVSGIHLAGAAPTVPFFNPGFKPAKVSTRELADSAKASRGAVLSSIRSSGDPEIDAAVLEKTIEELSRGWLAGPFEVESASKLHTLDVAAALCLELLKTSSHDCGSAGLSTLHQHIGNLGSHLAPIGFPTLQCLTPTRKK